MNVKGFNKELAALWLKLTIGKNRELHFRVRHVGMPGYRENDEWRLIDFVVLEGGKEEYNLMGDESLTANELGALEYVMDLAIDGKLERSWNLYTIEPILYFSVELRTGKHFRLMEMATVHNKSKTFVIDEKRDYTLQPFLMVRNDSYRVCAQLHDGNMRRLSWYLKLIKGEISLKDRRIRSMLRDGILYRDDGRFRKKQQEQEWEGYYNE